MGSGTHRIASKLSKANRQRTTTLLNAEAVRPQSTEWLGLEDLQPGSGIVTVGLGSKAVPEVRNKVSE